MTAAPGRPWAEGEPAHQFQVPAYQPPAHLLGPFRVPDDTSTQVMPAWRPEETVTAPLPLGQPEPVPAPRRNRIIALVPVHNGEADLAPAIEALLAQTRPLDEIIIISDNSTDGTVAVASRYPVTVVESAGNRYRKSGALNQAWRKYAQDADYVVCIDDDTRLPPFAVEHFEAEMTEDPGVGGISCQVVMRGSSILSRIQRAEFAQSTVLSRNRGWVRVISGTGCIFRNEALREAALLPGQEGPWTYRSVVEDYHLTFQLRKLGWLCIMSKDVWCDTGSMPSVKALWHQRVKWQSGTIGDLINFGFNRMNWREWMQQFYGLICVAFWILWLSLNGTAWALGGLHPNIWWVIFPAIFAGTECFYAWHIHGRDWKDMLLAVSMVKMMIYTFLCMGWNLASWWIILRGKQKDLWAAQYVADGTDKVLGEGMSDAGPASEEDRRPAPQALCR